MLPLKATIFKNNFSVVYKFVYHSIFIYTKYPFFLLINFVTIGEGLILLKILGGGSMQHLNYKKGLIMMMFSTLFWGFMGISSRYLNMIKLNSTDISFARCSVAAIIITVYMLVVNRSAFKVNLKSLLFCIFYGALNFGIGLSLYSLSVERIPISVATVLMFSNPIWVTLFGYLFFKDKVGIKKIVVISLCIFGCMCIIDIFSTGGMNLDIIGILAGVSNGMTFALQIVMPRFVDGKISKDSLLLYGFWSASILLAFFSNIPNIFNTIYNSSSPLFFGAHLLSIGALSTFIANTFYLKSTKYLGTHLPSMLVALEPIFASIFAFFIFGENMKPIQFIGALIVIGSVFALESSWKLPFFLRKKSI